MSDYDVVVVGAGPAGAIVAAELGAAGRRVLVLEAGPAAGRTWAEYQGNVERSTRPPRRRCRTRPTSPSDGAPFPDVLDITRLEPGGPQDDGGYFVQEGPLPFSSDYLRSAGGTTLHWLGTCLRMLPHDFEHGRRATASVATGRSATTTWTRFYERAEREFGVAGDVADQEYLGMRFSPDYVYPMHRIPPSYGRPAPRRRARRPLGAPRRRGRRGSR